MIAVFGSGSWGTALAAALARNNKSVITIWGRDLEVLEQIKTKNINQKYLPNVSLPENLTAEQNLEAILQKNSDILIAIPSKGFVEFIHKIKPYLTKEHRIVWATKGLEPSTGRMLHEVIESELGIKQVYAILSGPSFALEVAKNLPTAVTIATKNRTFGNDLINYFHCDTFRVYLSDDIVGVQLGGAIKNILAVAAGLSDGLGFGANARAALITRGLAEMMRLGNAMNAKIETLQGLAGVGDVILTCTDDKSRNRRFGLSLAKGVTSNSAQKQVGQVVEAAHNVAELCKLAAENDIELPIAEQVYLVLKEKISPQQAAENLVARKPRDE